MNSRFAPLLHLSVAGPSAGDPYPNMEFAVPYDTARALRRGRALLRRRAGTLVVLAERGDDAGAPRWLAHQRLRFGLLPRDPAFAIAMELPGEPAAVAVYGNADVATALDPPTGARLAGTVLRHTIARAARPLQVDLTDSAGARRERLTLGADDAATSVSFDLANATPGLYTVRESPAADGDATRYYVDPELVGEPLVGIVELQVAAAFYDAAPTFQAAFPPRRERLRYYVVVRGPAAAAAQLAVDDDGGILDGRPRIEFDAVPAAEIVADPIAAQLAADGGQVVSFRSRSLEPRRPGGRRKIRLMRNAEVLIDHLPSPTAEQPQATMTLHLTLK
ncbi:MAG: hypothetical protein ABI629_09220 [bacterium]